MLPKKWDQPTLCRHPTSPERRSRRTRRGNTWQAFSFRICSEQSSPGCTSPSPCPADRSSWRRQDHQQPMHTTQGGGGRRGRRERIESAPFPASVSDSRTNDTMVHLRKYHATICFNNKLFLQHCCPFIRTLPQRGAFFRSHTAERCHKGHAYLRRAQRHLQRVETGLHESRMMSKY